MRESSTEIGIKTFNSLWHNPFLKMKMLLRRRTESPPSIQLAALSKSIKSKSYMESHKQLTRSVLVLNMENASPYLESQEQEKQQLSNA